MELPTDDLRPQHVNFKLRFRQTKMCSFYLSGNCSRGEDCSYAHSQDELSETPDLWKTKWCKYRRKGCEAGRSCSFAHSRSELRQQSSSEGFNRTRVPVRASTRVRDLTLEDQEMPHPHSFEGSDITRAPWRGSNNVAVSRDRESIVESSEVPWNQWEEQCLGGQSVHNVSIMFSHNCLHPSEMQLSLPESLYFRRDHALQPSAGPRHTWMKENPQQLALQLDGQLRLQQELQTISFPSQWLASNERLQTELQKWAPPASLAPGSWKRAAAAASGLDIGCMVEGWDVQHELHPMQQSVGRQSAHNSSAQCHQKYDQSSESETQLSLPESSNVHGEQALLTEACSLGMCLSHNLEPHGLLIAQPQKRQEQQLPPSPPEFLPLQKTRLIERLQLEKPSSPSAIAEPPSPDSDLFC